MNRPIESFIHRKVIVLHETDTALQAAKAMSAHGVGSVMVSDHQSHITGVVTDRDLANRVLAESKASNCRLMEFMTSDVAFITENSTLDDAIELMAQKGIRRIPVLREMKSGHQRCIGIITLDDLLASDAIDSHSLKRIIKAQISRRLRVGRKDASREFLRQLATQLSVSEDRCEEVCRLVFGSVAQRLTYSAAVQFILQLPEMFQTDLFNLPPGPDRSITAQRLTDAAADLLDVPVEGVQQKLQGLWKAFEAFGDKNQLDHVLAQLPQEMADLLRILPSSGQSDLSQNARS